MGGHILWLDFETRSSVDIRKHGADVYNRSWSTEALILGWAIDDSPVRLWDIDRDGLCNMPHELLAAYQSPNVTKIAYNAPFDRGVFTHVIKLPSPVEQWKCAQVLAFSMAFAGRLKDVLGAVNLENKQEDGDKLIRRFCVYPPKSHKATLYTRHTHPEEWARFETYCKQDVAVLRKLWQTLEPYGSMSPEEWTLWHLDQKINMRGLPIDLNLVENAMALAAVEKKRLGKEVLRLTKLTTFHLPALNDWFNEHRYFGTKPMANMQKATKEAFLPNLTDQGKEVMEIELLRSQTSTTKWAAFHRRTDPVDHVLRDSLMFAGAGRTRRWAGRGVQVHNLKRTSRSTDQDVARIVNREQVSMQQLSTSIRSAITAPPGELLVVSDLSSIESRLAGWVSGCTAINAIFKQGKDVYKDLAARLYSVPYLDVTKDQRTFAKPAALGAQYMLGAKGLRTYAEGYGVKLSIKEAQHQIDIYRSSYPEIQVCWYWLKDAIFDIIQGRADQAHRFRVTIRKEHPFLTIQLPSGRKLYYFEPEIRMIKAPWDESELIPAFSYMGKDQFKNLWRRISAHAGGVFENIIQAIARDILAEWMVRTDKQGHTIIGHVHDEIICLEHKDKAQAALDDINRQAAHPIPWAPNLLLDAEGYIAKRYRKD